MSENKTSKGDKMKLNRSPLESPKVRSYRELLGITQSAGAEEIKKAYRLLASLYHPDKNLNANTHSDFIKITEAYETLCDPAKLSRLNKSYLDQRLYSFPIEGINISFGAFFGFRKFNFDRVVRERRLGKEKAGEEDSDIGIFELSKSDSSQSILDNPAFDSIELVYAGKFSLGDESHVLEGFKGQHLGQLPWVLLNNQGIIAFLEERFEDSLKCYEELDKRIPHNIIFLYRMGLCHTILGFKKKKMGFLVTKPDAVHIKKSIFCFLTAIAIGENRSVGKQKCLMIRKTLAELYEKIGERRKSKAMWRAIRLIDPTSAEVAFKLKIPRKMNLLRKF
jgi:curved DNA-binding protein CbpA